MTTKRTFFCNLCSDEIQPEAVKDTFTNPRYGMGFKWTGGSIEWTHVRQAENHLCDACMRALRQSLPSEIKDSAA